MISTKRLLRRAACMACLALFARAQGAPDRAASLLYEQGMAADAHGEYGRAEALFAQALELWRALGPAYAAHAASALVNLGQVRSNAGQWRAGAADLEEALQLNRRALGATHIRTVYNLSWLGHAALMAGDLPRAEAALAEALAIEREHYPDDVLVGHTLLGLSVLRRRQERFDEALAAGEDALRAALHAGPDDGVGVGMALENVAGLHLQARRIDRALPLYRKARSIYERTPGPASPQFAFLLSQEGLALLEDGKPALAESEMSAAAALLARMGPKAAPRLALAQTNLARLRLRQKKYGEADRLPSHAMGLQTEAGPATDLAATLALLAELRKAQNRRVESAELLARAAQLQLAR